MKFNERLRESRHAAGLTQEQLADRLGLTRSAVGQWESDKLQTCPSTEHLLSLAEQLDVSFEWLATGRGHMHNHYIAQPTAAYTNEVLTPKERLFINRFRALNERKRQVMQDLLELLESPG